MLLLSYLFQENNFPESYSIVISESNGVSDEEISSYVDVTNSLFYS